MTSLSRRVDGWLFAPAPPERLAVLRILAGGFATVYVLVRLPTFVTLTGRDAARFQPVGVLAWLGQPLPDTLLRALVASALPLGLAYALGARFRLTGPAFALVLLVLTTYRSSWGQLLHFENLMVLQVLVVGLAAGGADALSWDARRRRARRPAPAVGAGYGWPVRLAAMVTAATYVVAGLAKLRLGGVGWVLGDTLRNHVAYSAVRLEVLGGTPSPLGRALVGQAWVFLPLALATVLVELAAPVALLGGRPRNVWVAAAWLLHAGVAALMFVVFPYPLFLVAFAPLFRLEQLVAPARRAVRRPDMMPEPSRNEGMTTRRGGIDQ